MLTPKKNEGKKTKKHLSEKEKEKESVMDALFLSFPILTVQQPNCP